MTTLVERVRQVISAEDDDFFKDETVLDYLNNSQRKIVSLMTIQENRTVVRGDRGVLIGNNKTLRALDKLRKTEHIVLDGGGFLEVGGYYSGVVLIPAINSILNVSYKDTVPLKELQNQRRYMLKWGNLKPTSFESYYIVDDGGLEVILFENPDQNKLSLRYIKQPEDLSFYAQTLTELPERLENAVVYGAAVMMLGQESVKEPEQSGMAINQIYQEELKTSMY